RRASAPVRNPGSGPIGRLDPGLRTGAEARLGRTGRPFAPRAIPKCDVGRVRDAAPARLALSLAREPALCGRALPRSLGCPVFRSPHWLGRTLRRCWGACLRALVGPELCKIEVERRALRAIPSLCAVRTLRAITSFRGTTAPRTPRSPLPAGRRLRRLLHSAERRDHGW